MVIDGTREALPKNSLLVGLRADIQGRVLDPILPGSPELSTNTHARGRVALLRDITRDRMIRELAQMRGQSTGMAT
jgi:hypothetical protein